MIATQRELSPRQKFIQQNEREERARKLAEQLKANGRRALDDKTINANIDALLEQVRGDRSLAGTHSLGPPANRQPKKPQPLPRATQSRLDKLERFSKELKEKELNARVRKILGASYAPPERIDPLTAKIRAQLNAQPGRHRAKLSMLYDAWQAHNQVYFSGRLTLPILSVADLAKVGTLAQCVVNRKPCEIRFDATMLATKDDSFLIDILLHETIHAAISEINPGSHRTCKYGGHGQQFASICNKIARQRGWPDVLVHETEGKKAARFWPPRTQG